MAEKHSETGQDGYGSVAVVAEIHDVATSLKQTSKRCSTESTNTAPEYKSPRIDTPSPTQTTDTEGRLETDKQEMQTNNSAEPSSISPPARRKSWRRATLTRRSLPALPNPYQLLCRSISTSLSQRERLEKLMEASMRLVIDRTQNSLQATPNSSLKIYQKQVEHMQKEWGYLADTIRHEPQGHQVHASEPTVQNAMEKIKKAINRLGAESESWELLLNKHRNKAEQLERKVEQGREKGISVDSTSVAHSSQYRVIENKPDYHSLLWRQQPVLHTMTMIMDTQCKMVQKLLSIKEWSQLLVKETSGRLAAESGFQDLSPNLVRNLMIPPLSSE